MAARWLVAWVWGVVLLVGVVNAKAAPEPDLSRYEVYYGDMDSREYGLDGYPDLLLRARRDYTWISASVGIPVPLPSDLPDLLFCGTASGEFVPCILKDGAAIPAEPSDDFELIWGDGDGDGLPDLLVQAHDLNTRSLYLRSQKKGNLALMDQFIGLGGQRVSGMPDLGEEDEIGTENSAAVMSLAATSNSASTQSLTGQLVGASPGSLDVVQGQLRYSIPIQLPDGPGGINPSFSLDYSSDSGYGHAGMGFHISGLSAIERCPMRRTLLRDGISAGVAGTTADLACLDGQRLILVSGVYWGNGSVYRTEAESGIKVVYQRGSGATYHQGTFVVYHKDGDIYRYGASAATRIVGGPIVNNQVARWALEKVEDRLGQGYEIRYVAGSGAAFPSLLLYRLGHGTPSHRVEFQYLADSYASQSPIFGKAYSSAYRLKTILSKVSGQIIRSWAFAYRINPTTHRAQLKQFQECGLGGQCLSPTKLDWEDGARQGFGSSKEKTFRESDRKTPWRWWIDINGNGRSDFCRIDSDSHPDPISGMPMSPFNRVVCHFSDGAGGFSGSVDVLGGTALMTQTGSFSPNPAQSFWNLDPEWLDIDSDGYLDFCFSKPNGGSDSVRCYRNNAGKSFSERWSSNITRPVAARYVAQRSLADVDGDGVADYCYAYYVGTDKYIRCAKGRYNKGTNTLSFSQWISGPIKVLSVEGGWVDMNNDGLPEYCWFSGGKAQCYKNNAGVLVVASPQWSISASFLTSRYGSYWQPDDATFKSDFFDFNGNGYPDYCRFYWDQSGDKKNYRSRCLINNGKGWVADVISPKLPVNVEIITDYNTLEVEVIYPYGLSFADINQDGYTDWCVQDHAILKCQLSRNGAFTSEVVSLSLNQAPSELRGHVWADVKGDGIPRLCAMGKDSVRCWNGGAPKVPDYVTGVTNGMGLEYKVRYADTNDASAFGYGAFPVLAATPLALTSSSAVQRDDLLTVNAAMRVVSHLYTSNGVGGTSEQAYYYEDYGYYPNELGGMGFRYIRVDSENGNKRYETWYEQDGYTHRGSQLSKEQTSYKVGGSFKVVQSTQYNWETVIYQGAGFQLIPGAVSAWNGNAGVSLRYAVRLKSSIASEKELSGALIRSVQTTHSYNNYGDLEKQVATTTGTGQRFVQTTTSTFDNNETDWILGRQTRSTATTTATYQGASVPAITRTSAWEYYPSGIHKGMLKTEIIEPDQPEYRRAIEYTYNDFGLKETETLTAPGMAPRVTQYSYDPQGRFLTSVENALGHTVTYGYDAVTGWKTSQTDPNGLTTTWDYDPIGRLLTETGPGGQRQETRINGCDSACPVHATYYGESWTADVNGAAISPRTYEYKDLFGRTIETRTQGFSGQMISVRTEYDENAQVIRESEPYKAGQSPSWHTVNSRDVMGRPLLETAPTGLKVSTQYQGLTTVQTLSGIAPQTSSVTDDVLGQTRQTTDTGNRTLRFHYDAAGNLTRTVLPDQTELTTEYDTLGRKIASDDPNMGLWRYAYNGDGAPVLQENGNGIRVCMAYDALGRMIRRVDDYRSSLEWQAAIGAARNQCAGQSATTQWAYDDPTKGLGRLALVQHGLGHSESVDYDGLGRPIKTTVQLDGTTYTSEQRFDGITGRLIEEVLPHRHTPQGGTPKVTVEYRYNNLGYLKEIGNPEEPDYYYWRVTGQNVRGQVTQRLLAGGMMRESRGYRASDGLLSSKSVTPVYGDAHVYLRTYVYDAKGRMTTSTIINSMPVSGTVPPGMDLSEYLESIGYSGTNYLYDQHDRLVKENVSRSAFGDLLMEETFEYDLMGNITHHSGVGSYHYGETCNYSEQTFTPGPHAVTRTEGIRSGTYCYDHAGNMISGGGKQITYSGFNKPLSVITASAQAQFEYGAGRELLRMTVTAGNKTTSQVNLGQYEYVAVTENGITTEKERFSLPGGVILSFANGGANDPEERYLITDAVGSTEVIADNLGQVLERYRYDAWGRPRSPVSLASLTDSQWFNLNRLEKTSGKGFSGHNTLDEIGLVHMGGRIYDPTLGRFLSADPIVKGLGNVESYNRYAYALNSPLNYTDPSGYSWLSKAWKKLRRSVKKRFGLANLIVITPEAGRTLFTMKVVGREMARFAARNKYAGEILSVAGMVACAGSGPMAPACVGTLQGWMSASIAYENGASVGEALFAGVYSGGLAYMNAGVAGLIGDAKLGAMRSGIAHGGRGAYFAAMRRQGGRGIWSGLVGGFTEGVLAGYISGGLERADLDPTTNGVLTAALVSGTASEATGGKFAVGAATGAMGYLANWLRHYMNPQNARSAAIKSGADQVAGTAREYAEPLATQELVRRGGLLIGGGITIVGGVEACASILGCMAGVPMMGLGSRDVVRAFIDLDIIVDPVVGVTSMSGESAEKMSLLLDYSGYAFAGKGIQRAILQNNGHALRDASGLAVGRAHFLFYEH